MLQIETFALAVCLQFFLDVDGCGQCQGCRFLNLFDVRLFVAKCLKRLNTPEQEANDGECLKLGQILSEHFSRVREIDLIDEEEGGCEQQALPYLLVLEVGIVLAQPTTIMYQLVDIIQGKDDHDDQLPVCRQVKTVEPVVPHNAYDSRNDDGQLRQKPRPERSLAVLQHAEQ